MRTIHDRNLILPIDPTPQIDQLAPLRAKRKVHRQRLIFSRLVNFLLARRTLHDKTPQNVAQSFFFFGFDSAFAGFVSFEADVSGFAGVFASDFVSDLDSDDDSFFSPVPLSAFALS